MNITCFDDLLTASRTQSTPQTLLMLFLDVELPEDASAAERERFEQQPSQSTAPAAHAPKVVGEQQYTQRTYTPTQDAMDAMMQEWEESHA